MAWWMGEAFGWRKGASKRLQLKEAISSSGFSPASNFHRFGFYIFCYNFLF
jgi:hypothetical protein